MSRVNKQSVLLFIGNPSTGKTTSTQRVYYQFLNNYMVSLLTTLSIRIDQGTINDLYSEENNIEYENINENSNNINSEVNIVLNKLENEVSKDLNDNMDLDYESNIRNELLDYINGIDNNNSILINDYDNLPDDHYNELLDELLSNNSNNNINKINKENKIKKVIKIVKKNGCKINNNNNNSENAVTEISNSLKRFYEF